MPATLNLHWLSAGHCLQLEAITRRGAPWRAMRYPAGFALLQHPTRGPVLFDTGYAPRVATLCRAWPARLYALVTPMRIGPQDSAAARLQALGISPEAVREVIVSHFHADHVGGLRDFPNATFRFAPEAHLALRGLTGLRAVRRAYLPDLLPPDFDLRAEPLRDKDWQPTPPDLAPFTRAHDLFGDGSAWAVPIPGHAPGQIALVIRTPTGRALLLADGAWSTAALREGAPPHPLATLAFSDPQAERRSFRLLSEFLRRHPDVRAHASHDPQP